MTRGLLLFSLVLFIILALMAIGFYSMGNTLLAVTVGVLAVFSGLGAFYVALQRYKAFHDED